MNSIPFIGVPVVTNTKWVKRLVASVDYPVENFFIVNNNGRGEIDTELDALAATPHPFIKKFKVTHLPANLGVAGSWNLMIKCYMLLPFWIIVNDDVAFCPGFLEEMLSTAVSNPGAHTVHGFSGDFNVGSWDLFLLRDHAVQEFGLFDENLYPAYSEDADYLMRFMKRPVQRVLSLSGNYWHGDGMKNEYYAHGSQTGKSNSELKTKLDEVGLKNIDYLTEKWGIGWRYCAPTFTPYESVSASMPVSSTKFDLRFVRSKHLGF